MALTTKRIIALPSQTDPQEGDYLAIDNATSGTHKIPVGRIGVEVDDTLTEAGKAADAKATGDALDEIRSQIEVTGTASGAIATFADGSDAPMKSCTVTIEPQQSGSGTPSPDNVRAISGWESVDVTDTGKNLLPKYAEGTTRTQNGITGTANADGSITYVGTSTGTFWGLGNSDAVLIKAGTYTLTARNNTDIAINIVNADTSAYINGVTGSNSKVITFANDTKIYYYTAIASGKTVNTTATYQLELGATATAYEPYTGTTTPVNLGRTVYGGTLDVVSGVLTVTHGYQLFDSSVPCYGVSTNYGTGFNRVLYSTLENEAKRGANIPIVSDKFAYIATTALALYKGHINSNGILCLGVPDTITTTAEMQAWAGQNPFVIVYELATPQTYQLTPTEVSTLLGENNVWADAGDVEVVYVRDLNITINNLLNNSGTRSLGMMAMSAPTEATAEEPTDEQTEEPTEDDMR